MNLKKFIIECQNKEVFKMLSIYIISSWVILQVLSVVADPLGLPKKSVTFLIIIFLVGFPIYIYYIWKFKLLKYEIQQTEDPTTPYNKSAFQRMYFSSLFIIGLLSSVAIALIIKNNFVSEIKLEEIKGNNKIAVLNFENTTGVKKLDNLGKIASNWIIHGIEKNNLGEVISPKIVDDYINILKSQVGNDNESISSLLKNYFKPGKVINGVFYMEKGKLLLQGSIKNGLIEKNLVTFETFSCDPDSPIDCIEKLKQKILGYLSIEDKAYKFYEETPPRFEALKYSQSAIDNIDNDELHLEFLEKAIESDPNYFEPKLHRIAFYYNRGQYKIADSLLRRVNLTTNPTDRQQNILIVFESIMKGKNGRAYKAQLKEYQQASIDVTTNQTTMTIALQYVNRPEDIEAIFNDISMDDMLIEKCSRCVFRYYIKGLADVELGNYNQVINTLLPLTKTVDYNLLKLPVIKAYISLDKNLALEKFLSDYSITASTKDMNYLNLYTGIQFLIADKPEEAKRYFNKVLNSNQTSSNQMVIAKAYYYTGDYINAEKKYSTLHELEPDNVEYLVYLAICNYKNDKIKDAQNLIEKLKGLKTDYQFGAINYGLAQYYVTIGDNKKAFENLEKSVAQGFNYTPSTFQNDYHFITIKNTPEFKNRIMNYWKNKAL